MELGKGNLIDGKDKDGLKNVSKGSMFGGRVKVECIDPAAGWRGG